MIFLQLQSSRMIWIRNDLPFEEAFTTYESKILSIK